MSELQVDTDRLRQAAPKFADAGGDLAAALTQLQSVLAGCAAMCGDDEQGRTFAKGYEPAAKTIAESLTFGSKAVKEVGTAVTDMAKSYDEMDETNVRASRTTGGGK